MYLVCVCAHYCMGIRGQFEKSQFFPSSMWVLESTLWLSGLVSSQLSQLTCPSVLFQASVYNTHFCLSHKMNIPLKYEALRCDIS